MKRAQALNDDFQTGMGVDLVDELKNLRRGSGLTMNGVSESPTLMRVFMDDAVAVWNFIELWCRDSFQLQTSEGKPQGRLDERYALSNAFGLASDRGANRDLTTRRQTLADNLGVSTRTVINYEDSAIRSLVGDILLDRHELDALNEFSRANAIGPRRGPLKNPSEMPAAPRQADIDREREVLAELSDRLERYEIRLQEFNDKAKALDDLRTALQDEEGEIDKLRRKLWDIQRGDRKP